MKSLPKNTQKEKLNKLLKSFKNNLEFNSNPLNYLQANLHDFNSKISDVLKYKKSLSYQDYYNKYLRQDVSRRIINCFPDSIWRGFTKIKTEDEEKEKRLNYFFNELIKKFKLIDVFCRADKLARIGGNSYIFVGAAGNVQNPINFQNMKGTIKYLEVFSERSVKIESYEENTENERCGKPLYYNIRSFRKGVQRMTFNFGRVHHTRVIEINRNSLENTSDGISDLKSIYNRLDDLEKVVGGSSQIFWLNARGGLTIDTNYGGDDTQYKNFITAAKKQLQNYSEGLERFLTFDNAKINPLELKVWSPKDNYDIILKNIAAAVGMPLRILLGNEAGEMASTQDETSYWSRVREERFLFSSQKILIPFINFCMQYNELPKIDFEIQWDDDILISELQKSEIIRNKSIAIQAYFNSLSAQHYYPPEVFFKEVLKTDYIPNNFEFDYSEEQKEIAAQVKDSNLEAA